MKTEKVVEGKTELIVPRVGYPPKRAPVFYNPRMEFSRTVSVCLLKAVKGAKRFRIVDAQAASGARGLRYLNEAGGELFFFDHNPLAVSLIKRNLRSLGLKATVERGDANSLLSRTCWDIVDIDPFGTPVPFLDSAARTAKKLVMATATDTTVLCGVYPEVCRRVYGALPLRSDFCHEVATRILAGKMVIDFARYEKALTPMLCHSTEHYFRVFGGIRKGAKRANAALKEMGWIVYCPKCRQRELRKGFFPEKEKCDCGSYYGWYGPLWAGNLFDRKLLKGAEKKAKGYGEKVQKFFGIVVKEAGVPAPYYNVHELASLAKCEAPKMDRLIAAIRKKGFKAAPSHMDSKPTVRTDCKMKELKKIMRST